MVSSFASVERPIVRRRTLPSTRYGIEAPYSSHAASTTLIPAERVRSSLSSRLFPIPGGPTISRSRPVLLGSASTESMISRSSSSRPTRGGSARSPCRRIRSSAPTENARIGFALPFTTNGGRGSTRKQASDAARTPPVAMIWPGAASLISRAARFTASPMIVYVRRYSGPMFPANTGPRFTPSRTANRRRRSTISCSVRSMRSSSSPTAAGAPAARMILPPSRSTSDPRNVTPLRSAASCTSHTNSCSASAADRRPSSVMSRSMPS